MEKGFIKRTLSIILMILLVTSGFATGVPAVQAASDELVAINVSGVTVKYSSISQLYTEINTQRTDQGLNELTMIKKTTNKGSFEICCDRAVELVMLYAETSLTGEVFNNTWMQLDDYEGYYYKELIAKAATTDELLEKLTSSYNEELMSEDAKEIGIGVISIDTDPGYLYACIRLTDELTLNNRGNIPRTSKASTSDYNKEETTGNRKIQVKPGDVTFELPYTDNALRIAVEEEYPIYYTVREIYGKDTYAHIVPYTTNSSNWDVVHKNSNVLTGSSVGTSRIMTKPYDGGDTTTFTVTVYSDTLDIAECTISDVPDQYYNSGEEIKPEITITSKDGTTILTEDTDYSLGYTSNTGIGTATITITGLGDYAGSTAFKNFNIVQRPVTAKPEADTSSGSYDSTFPVAFSCNSSGATIYYRLLETEEPVEAPEFTGELQTYTAPIQLAEGKTTYIQAFAQKEGLDKSVEVVYHYTVAGDKDYTLTVNGSSGSNTYCSGTTVTLTADEKDGFLFDHWQQDEGSAYVELTTEGSTVTFTMPRGDVSLTAVYQEIPVYTLQYDKNDGSDETTLASKEARSGETVSVEDFIPERNGYIFSGWNTAADGSGTPYNAGDNLTLTESVTLYAQWVNLGARLLGHSLTLDGTIGINFYMDIDDAVINSETAVICFTRPDGTTYDVPVKDGKTNEIGTQFVLQVYSFEMADTVTMQFIDGEKMGPVHSYSVRKYAETIINDTTGVYTNETKELVQSMLNYGAKSQLYFDYNTEELADAGYTYETTAAVPNDIGFVKPTKDIGVTYHGATLVLNSETSVKFYFNLTEGSIQDYRFYINDIEVQPKAYGGSYVIRQDNIAAYHLDQEIQVKVTKVENTEEAIEFNYSPLIYLERVYHKSSSAKQTKDLMEALYCYHLAAKKAVNG